MVEYWKRFFVLTGKVLDLLDGTISKIDLLHGSTKATLAGQDLPDTTLFLGRRVEELRTYEKLIAFKTDKGR